MTRAATKEQADTLFAMRLRLDPLARKFDAPPVHWLGGGDEGLDYCFECAEIEVEKLKGKNPDGDYCVDGGWEAAREADGSVICYGCNRSLGYSLTSHGFSDEVDHYLESVIECPLQPGTAYEIQAVLDAARYSSEPMLIADALKIGAEAMASIEQGEQGEHLAICRWADDGGANLAAI